MHLAGQAANLGEILKIGNEYGLPVVEDAAQAHGTLYDEALARQLHILGNYGQKEKGQHVAIGMNNHLDTLQAAILQIKLAHLPEWNGARCEHASLYKHLLKDISDITRLSISQRCIGSISR